MNTMPLASRCTAARSIFESVNGSAFGLGQCVSVKETLKMKLIKAVVQGAVLTSCFLCVVAFAQQIIKVSQLAWSNLAPAERDFIQKSYVVSVISQDSFGLIIDNQGVNESTSGTNGGAALGGSIANAAYVDSAIRGRNYSAVNQLAIGILGAMVGSTLDSKARAQYHHRYAVKFGNGNIQYFDQVSTEAFRHPVGVCVSVPNVALTEQQLCAQTADSLRMVYLRQMAVAPPPLQPPVIQVLTPTAISTFVQTGTVAAQADVGNLSMMVNCKLGTLAPVRTSAEKCELVNGSQVQ